MTEQALADVRRRARIPDGVCYTFDAQPKDGTEAQHQSPICKTTRRTVVSLGLGRFQAREVVRRAEGVLPRRSAALATLVPKRMRYDFELIAHVGIRSFLDAQNLEQLQRELANRSPAIEVPLSSLHDLRGKFLFLFGALHRQAAPAMRLAWQAAPGDWLIDGTLEPGTPLFFGIQETRWGVMLDCWKVPSEKGPDLARCLRQAAEQFGKPPRVVHDLGAAMASACEEGLPGVAQRVCHFHFASDVGEGLYQKPQQQLSSRLQTLGVQVRMHDQRKAQTNRLRQQLESGQAELVLGELLTGHRPAAPWSLALAREVLLALHNWVLSYPQDGRRQGFPFDPYLLYLHRRLLKAGATLDRLLADTAFAARLPVTFANLQQQLTNYRTDAEVVAAAELYEKAHALFERLRAACG